MCFFIFASCESFLKSNDNNTSKNYDYNQSLSAFVSITVGKKACKYIKNKLKKSVF